MFTKVTIFTLDILTYIFLGLNIREVLEEDEGGSIEKSIAKLVAETRKKQRTLEKPAKIRLGIVSWLSVHSTEV